MKIRKFNIIIIDIRKIMESISTRMAVYDAEYFCTGHGVILKHNITEFLNKLSDDIIKYEISRQS